MKKKEDINGSGRDKRGRFTKGTAGHRLAAPRPVEPGMTLADIVVRLCDQYKLGKVLVQRALIGDMRAVELVLDFIRNAPQQFANQYDTSRLDEPELRDLQRLLAKANTANAAPTPAPVPVMPETPEDEPDPDEVEEEQPAPVAAAPSPEPTHTPPRRRTIGGYDETLLDQAQPSTGGRSHRGILGFDEVN